jgi:hypothetical protein
MNTVAVFLLSPLQPTLQSRYGRLRRVVWVFKHSCRSHPRSYTHTHYPKPLSRAAQVMHKRHHLTSSCAPQRVSQCDSPSERVDLRFGNAQYLHAVDTLASKRFVHLEDGHVVHREIRPAQGLRNRHSGADAHHPWGDAYDRVAQHEQLEWRWSELGREG